ncbi:hypothetical protein N9954_09350 [Maribacter sp.]|nr:hypothetical protein [Maribacter sp.]
MELSLIKLLFDFGLLVLIWMVQLLIYPSFKFMDKQSLLVWHPTYSKGISVIVIPLMLSQFALSVLLLIKDFSLYRSIDTVLVILVWAITFIIFVPTHQALSTGKSDVQLRNKLVNKNWYRTFIWTVIFLADLCMVIYYW